MAIVVKDPASVTKKWQTNAGAASAFYASGVQNPRRDQTAAAVAAASTWASGVQMAAANNTFVKGLQRNPGKWQARAGSVGVQRYPGGITAGAPNYQTEITAVLNVISNITLTQARMPRGDPANWARSQQVGQALHAWRLSR